MKIPGGSHRGRWRLRSPLSGLGPGVFVHSRIRARSVDGPFWRFRGFEPQRRKGRKGKSKETFAPFASWRFQDLDRKVATPAGRLLGPATDRLRGRHPAHGASLRLAVLAPNRGRRRFSRCPVMFLSSRCYSALNPIPWPSTPITCGALLAGPVWHTMTVSALPVGRFSAPAAAQL